MRILLSPAKKMRQDIDTLEPLSKPVFLEQSRIVLDWLKEKSYEELKTLWNCSDTIAMQNTMRLKEIDLDKNLTPAMLSYEGIAYQYMAPSVFENTQLSYVQEHLRILSAFYGVLKPMDGIVPYRLEMQAKAKIDGHKNLYDFWGRCLYQEVSDDGVLINLASKEYAKCILPYLEERDRCITVDFCEMSKGKLVTKGTYAKMARGEMVRFMAENGIEEPEQIKHFDRLDYTFREDLSTEDTYIFERIS